MGTVAKKILLLILLELFAFSCGLNISAVNAPVAYDKLTVEENSICFTESSSQKSVSKSMRDKNVTILTDKKQDLCVCFFDQDDVYRTYTLGA